MSFDHVVHRRACCPWSAPEEWLTQSPSGKRVPLRRDRPGFVHSVHLTLPQQTSRKHLCQAEMIRLQSRSQLLEPLQREVCLLDLSSAPCTGLSCDPTCHRPTLAGKIGIVSPSLHRCLSCPAFLLSFPFLPFLPFPHGALHLPDVHRRRRVWSRVSSMIVVGSLCQCPVSHVHTQGLIIPTICQGNHFQEITVSCWCACSITIATWAACWRSVPAATLYCATSFFQEASMLPKSRPSLCIFSIWHVG